MDRAQTQSIIGQLRDEIRRREAALPAGSLGVLASGFAPLDALLPGGGFPRGRVVELVGSRASGKTTLALSALARASAEGQLVAYVDPAGELYPPAAQGLGADLTRLLIVRPREATLGLRVASLLARSKAFAAVAIDLPAVAKGPLGPLSRRLLEAAETGRAAIILLCDGPSGLDTSLRLSVERLSPTELALAVERSRLGPPGRAERGALASPDEPHDFTGIASLSERRRDAGAPDPGRASLAVPPRDAGDPGAGSASLSERRRDAGDPSEPAPPIPIPIPISAPALLRRLLGEPAANE